MLRAVADAESAVLEERCVRLERERDEHRRQAAYWQKRAELYIDRAASRAGITHEPVMTETATPPVEMLSALAGMAMQEFNSTETS